METEPIVDPSTHEDPWGGVSLAKENGNHNLRRRCWDEAFASASESDSISPEPALGQKLPEENVEGVDMCSSTTSDCRNGKATSTTSIVCEAHPSCFKTFSIVRELEDHYNLRHRHKCITCKKSLPSAHILELHVLEAHDTLFSLMAERKPMLACFLETCSTTFWKSDERKEHCLTEHRFPKSFYLWDLTAMGGNKPGKKSGGGSSKGKGANKQNQHKDKKSPPNLKEKSTTTTQDSVSEDVSSTSTNGVSAMESTSVPAATPPNETMELDAPLVVEHKKKNQKPESSSNNKNKNSSKFLPTQITFGRHSASRTFKPNYSFGLTKPAVVPEGVSSSMSAGKTELDMSDIKDVLPISTVDNA